VLRRISIGAFALQCLLGFAGCAGFASDRTYEIEELAHVYADCLRFGHVERAAGMVDPALRQDFLALFNQQDALRFTSIDVARVDVSPGADHATVHLTVRLYRLPSVREVEFADASQWHYDRQALAWRVEPNLSLYERAGL